MSFYAISALINAIASLTSGLLVILKKGKDPVYITFALFSFSVFVWSTGYFIWQYTTTPENALIAIRFFMGGAIFISTTFLHFVWTFIGESGRYKRALVASYVIFGLFFFANFTPWFVSGVTQRMSFSFWPVPGPLFHPFFLFWAIQVIFVLALLYRAHKKSSGEIRKQLEYIFLGTTLGFLGGSTNYFLWYGIPVSPVGNILVASYVIAVAIAILRYHLFDIKLILVELAILLLNLFLFLNVFTSHARADLIMNVSVSVFILAFSIILIRGIYKDIRDRERIEELAYKMEVSNEKLRMMEGQKTEFVSIASHQLRTPLTVIKGYASMVLEGTFGTINDSARDAMEKLYKSSERIVALVEDLLTVSRIEQGRMMLALETVNYKDFVQATLAEIENVANEAKIDLTFTAEEGKEFFVDIDEKKFKQVIKHILENAIKYTPAPGSVRVAVSDDELTKKVRLTISDTGIGMTAEQITAIFERFNLKVKEIESREHGDQEELGRLGELGEQWEQKQKEEVAESKMMEKRNPGIGLYIAQEIIEAHHGTIRIESEGPDRGTTVVVELPRVSATEGGKI